MTNTKLIEELLVLETERLATLEKLLKTTLEAKAVDIVIEVKVMDYLLSETKMASLNVRMLNNRKLEDDRSKIE